MNLGSTSESSRDDEIARAADALGEISKQVKSIKTLLIVYVAGTIALSVVTSIMAMTGAFTGVIREQLEEAREQREEARERENDSPAGPAVRDPLPAISLPAASGKLWNSSELKGKVVLLNFWATWCGPCRKEMPWFKEFQAKYASQGFTIVAISTDRKGWDVVGPYVEKLQPNFPVLVADKSVTDAFGRITSLPTTFLVHRSGIIHSKIRGAPPKTRYVEMIESLLQKDPLKAARELPPQENL